MSIVRFVASDGITGQNDQTVANLVIPDNSFIIAQMSERGAVPDGVAWGGLSLDDTHGFTTIHSVQNTRYRLHYAFVPVGGTEDLVFDVDNPAGYMIGTYAIWTNVSGILRSDYKDNYLPDGSDFPAVEEYAQGATIILAGGRNAQPFSINNAVNVVTQGSDQGRGHFEMGVAYPDTMQTSTAFYHDGSGERDGAVFSLQPLHVGAFPIMF